MSAPATLPGRVVAGPLVRYQILLGLMLMGGIAHADPALARQHFDKAARAFNLQEWRVALDEFRGAYAESGDPSVLFNIAQCQRQLGRYDEAAREYRLYLTNLPAAPNRGQVETLIRQMDEAGRAQLRAREAPPPGTAPLSISAAPASRRPWYHSPTGWSLTGGGLAVLIVGAALLGAATSAGSSAAHAGNLVDQTRFHDDDMRLQAAGWPLLGVGGASMVVGAIVFGVEAR